MVRSAPEVDQPTYEIVDTVMRFDQRDHANARNLLVTGTPGYEEYYSRHPELKEWDDETKRINGNSTNKLSARDPVNTKLRPAAFYGRVVLGAQAIVEGAVADHHGRKVDSRVDVDPGKMARKVKDFARYLGAGDVLITRLKQDWIYTNFAHPYTPEPYGKPVKLDYENIICMAFPQDIRMIKCGVGTASDIEVGWRYAFASLVSVLVAHFIRGIGWRARALPPENSPYLVVPTFIDAGIGEQGRCGFVVSKTLGNNFRPGAVATDMPLALDKPVDFGLQDFCDKCLICADYCPSGTIPRGGKKVVRGVRRWATEGDKCRRYWATSGHNCSICQAVCPWNHPPNLLHNSVRELSQKFVWFRSPLIRAEKFFYKYRPAPQPEWITARATADTSEELKA